jgi:hypothetical protein
MTEPADPTEPAGAQTTLRWNDPLAVEATAAAQRGQADHLLDSSANIPSSPASGSSKTAKRPASAPCSISSPTGPATAATRSRSGPSWWRRAPTPTHQESRPTPTPLRSRAARARRHPCTAALGLIDRVRVALESEPRPNAEQITTAFRAACGGDHQDVAARLLAAGADINWLGWNNQTPLDAARCADAADLEAWLEANGARPAPTP